MYRGVVVAGLAVLLAGCGSDPEPAEQAAGESPSGWEAEANARDEQNADLQAELAESSARVDEAYEFCIEQITEQLKAPATARFSPRDDEHEGQEGDRRFLFTGTVDSENSFGALLRSEWACDIRWTSAGFVAEQAVIG